MNRSDWIVLAAIVVTVVVTIAAVAGIGVGTGYWWGAQS